MLDARAAAKTMKIRKPVLSSNGKWTRVTAQIEIGDDIKSLWFEVEEEYGQYLCHERSDAYLIGLLWIAMVNHYDIECEAPVTGELLHQVETTLIPSLVKNSGVMRAPKITCPIEPNPLTNIGAVGTGMSCGVDSLHTIKAYYQHSLPNFRLTHLSVYNVGAFGLYDICKAETQFKWQVENSRRLADELGLKLVAGNSNFKNEFFTDHRYTCTYVNMFGVLMLQKLWGVYFYASLGCGMEKFSVVNADRVDAAHYDSLALDCYSTRNLKIYSEAAALSRFEKTRAIVELPLSRKYLHVCCLDNGRNCGKCFKCKRTLVSLDALGVVDQYGEVFDVGYYKKHRTRYMCWLLAQVYGRTHENDLIHEAYVMLRGSIPWYCHVPGVLVGVKERIKSWAKNSLFVYQLYFRLRGYPIRGCSTLYNG